ncbi:flagellar assembly protein FlgT [Neisseriaceae bacterium TC5R-5]|nr:flagellar assembly protein FlgT [Neisseriaceae bacterium TC5R-5]
MITYFSLVNVAVTLLVAVFLSGTTHAEILSAEGVAPLEQGVTAARDLAMQDALKLLALSQGARVESAQLLDKGQLTESGSLTPIAPAQGQLRIVKEFAKDGLYHVLVELDTGSKPAAAATTVAAGAVSAERSRCAMPPGRALRRRLVTTYFQVDRPAEASDMPELATMLPTELARRLGHKPLFTVRDANTVSLLADGHIAEPAAGAEMARRIGQQEGVQFVVAGRVLSTSVTAKGVKTSWFESNNTSQQGIFYNGPFAGLVGGAVKYVPTERQFDAEVWLYDGLTGALLARERVGDMVRGQVALPLPRPFASTAFWQTDYGGLVDKVLTQASERISELISCIPFAARVVKVNGKQVYLNAGLLDGLAVGDKLLLYKPQSAQLVRELVSGRELGIPEILTGDVTITQVQPNFAIGIAQLSGQKVEEGDYARFMPQR